MELKTCASVGNVMLVPALGVAEPYKLKNRYSMDNENPFCEGCPHKTVQYNEHCKGCSKFNPVVKTTYVYEEKEYGDRRSITLNGLKVMLYLHFSKNLSSFGIVPRVPMQELCDKLSVTMRTVRNVFNELVEKKYITCTPTSEGMRDVRLLDYCNYFKVAKDGGKGYSVLNSAFLNEFLKVKDINEARIYIRSIIDINRKKEVTESFVDTVSKPFLKLKRELPSYMRTRNIALLIDKVKSKGILSAEYTNHSSVVKFTLDSSFVGKKTRKENVDAMEKKLKDYIEYLNQAIFKINTDPLNHSFDEETTNFVSNLDKHLMILGYKFDFNNLACLAEWYSLDKIKEGIRALYVKYNLKKYKSPKFSMLDNIGSFIRDYLDSKYKDVSVLCS